jgi:peptidoglycan LD-endopeptidase CwlK
MSRFKFGARSLERLRTCDPLLQHVIQEAMALDLMDFTVLVGHRDRAAQEEAFFSGASKLRWPDSKHNSFPSLAIDIAPWPIRWGDKDSPTRVKDIGRFYKLAGIVLAASRQLQIPVRWGGDWNMNGDVYDQTFDDLVHFELWERK